MSRLSTAGHRPPPDPSPAAHRPRRLHRHQSLRALRRLVRTPAAALLGFALLAFAPPAHADVLVSTLGQSDFGVGRLTHDHAQAFTTGNYAGSYTLTGVDVRFRNIESSDDFAVELWSESEG